MATKDLQDTLIEATNENALYLRDKYSWVVNRANNANSELSHEVTLVSSTVMALFAIFNDKFQPDGQFQKGILIGIVVLLIAAIAIGIVNKLMSMWFFEKDIEYCRSNANNWMNARNEMYSDESDKQKIFDKAVAYQSGLESTRKLRTSNIPLYLQLGVISMSLLLALLYFVVRI